MGKICVVVGWCIVVEVVVVGLVEGYIVVGKFEVEVCKQVVVVVDKQVVDIEVGYIVVDIEVVVVDDTGYRYLLVDCIVVKVGIVVVEQLQVVLVEFHHQ